MIRKIRQLINQALIEEGLPEIKDKEGNKALENYYSLDDLITLQRLGNNIYHLKAQHLISRITKGLTNEILLLRRYRNAKN